MQGRKILMMCAVGLVLAIGITALGDAGQPRKALLKQYWGHVKSLKIDRCGYRPGQCEGSIVLTERQGVDVVLSIRPGTWIKRGDRLVLLDELAVGHEIHVQAVELTEDGSLRATTVEVSTQPQPDTTSSRSNGKDASRDR
jgi:hypothetical protein